MGQQRKYCSGLCSVRASSGVPIPAPAPCPECGSTFTPVSARQRYCTKKCAGRACNRRYLAAHPEKAAKYRAAAQAAGTRQASWHLRRARKVTTAVERFTSVEIYERDGWCCGLCRRQVDSRLKYPHPMSASLDHIVPLSLGGEHVRSNAQLAHLDCNVRKGAGAAGEQLRLVG